ncbi:hypothetical protein J43TS9_05430 [Paenibacillus cineris]|nr:hypothetical protein J43TS9_05430 [Paenibacillus cineris]
MQDHRFPFAGDTPHDADLFNQTGKHRNRSFLSCKEVFHTIHIVNRVQP